MRRLAAAAVALSSCLALAGPAGSAGAAPADPVPTVFFGDSYTANFGIAPFNQDGKRDFCFQAKETYPTVATRRLADKGITLDVQSDVSCGGALVEHFWQEQELLLPGMTVPPQQDALKRDTQLAVGSMGGNTLGFNRILKQCSDELRGHPLLPGEPVDGDEPASKCGEFFESGDGKRWLDGRFEQVGGDLEELLDRKSQPLCLIGDSGTGKSHMLIALGTEAAMKGYRVRYTLATKLVNELVEAADEKQLNKTIARYGRVDLLCIDELAYMELDCPGAELLFQVLSEREEKNSVAIASNESFGGWTKTFTDPRLCAAIVDRLTFNGTIIETGTDSYRLASTRARAEEQVAAS
ncbi:ATP-binding protein [Streptomyces atratus]|uniref:IstB-like ATP-binding domain-containing protein n=1 Tax=Streptomyces atratus TaxID=1893 RepID=A0A2Z5JQ95_STRAR|nr:ATP-binding protein [Streptomyces atratus]AXE82641.1 hypothetical protein C5746_06860 [Streptomyces atratus]